MRLLRQWGVHLSVALLAHIFLHGQETRAGHAKFQMCFFCATFFCFTCFVSGSVVVPGGLYILGWELTNCHLITCREHRWGWVGSETVVSKILPFLCSSKLGQPFLVSACLSLFSVSLCLSRTSFIFSGVWKLISSSSPPQTSGFFMTLRCISPHLQSSIHCQPPPYLTSELSMLGPPPPVSPHPWGYSFYIQGCVIST